MEKTVKFIIEGHGEVDNHNKIGNINPELINRIKNNGDIIFYNLAKPASTIKDVTVTEAIKNIVEPDSTKSEEKLCCEGTFKSSQNNYLTTSIQDKKLTSLKNIEWLIKGFIEDKFSIFQTVLGDLEFYKNKSKDDIIYIKIKNESKKSYTLSVILEEINKIKPNCNKEIIWAACHCNS